jgi:hypothetical protein
VIINIQHSHQGPVHHEENPCLHQHLHQEDSLDRLAWQDYQWRTVAKNKAAASWPRYPLARLNQNWIDRESLLAAHVPDWTKGGGRGGGILCY